MIATLDGMDVYQDRPPVATKFQEQCRKCRGLGTYGNFGKCFACKGVGYREFIQSPEVREKQADTRRVKKERSAADNIEFFKTANPEIMEWIEAARVKNDFAQSMFDTIVKYGVLTDRQLAACQKSVDARKARIGESEARKANAPEIITDKLMAAFTAALATGLKRPVMRFEGFSASLAPAHGKNAGAVYIKNRETYLGKIQDGKFVASRECDAETQTAVILTMKDPLTAAVAYGRRTGQCSCCGRGLVNKESVSRGIGPICAEKFGL